MIRDIVEAKIANTDLFITDIKVLPGNNIKVALDKMNAGIVIADCVSVSRDLETKLDRNKEDFQLEVSSAGLEEPFKVKQQYFKNTGKKVDVITLDGKNLTGMIISANENGIELEYFLPKGKGKTGTAELINLPYQQIKQTKKVISFK